MWRLLVLLLVAPAAFGVPIPNPVYTDNRGREWVDLVDTSWRSYVEVVNVCSSATGYCDGVLKQNNGGGIYSPDIDLTGFTWATIDEVKDLFYEVGDLPAGSLDTGHAVFDSTDGHGAKFFDYFELTIGFNSGPYVTRILNGFARDLRYDPEQGRFVSPVGELYSTNYSYDYFTADYGWPVGFSDPSIGVYVYRVPEPGALGLFGLGLLATALISVARRRRSRRQVLLN